MQAQTLNGRFKRNAARALSKSKDREKGARAEDCVRLYDALVKASLDLERAANLNGIAPAAAEALVARSEAFAALYAAARCYYIAHLRLAKRTPDDLATAQALFDSSRERLLASVEVRPLSVSETESHNPHTRGMATDNMATDNVVGFLDSVEGRLPRCECSVKRYVAPACE